MPAPASDWLDRDVIVCLEEKCGTLDMAVKIAYESGSVGDELHSLGVRDLSTFGPPPNYGADVYVPEGRERVVWARVVEYHGCEAQTADEFVDVEPDLSGKPLPAVATLQALRAYASETSIQQVAKDNDIDLSFRGARRVYSWVDSGAVWWDRTQQKVGVAAGYSLIRGGTKTKPTLQLTRV
jgi:hypothetical protein